MPIFLRCNEYIVCYGKCSRRSTFNTTTEVPLSKAPNPQLLPGHRSIGCPLLQMLTDGLEWCGLRVDYCDVFISCLDSHSDGTHSLQSIHCITVTMKAHPRWELLENAHMFYTGAGLMVLGSVFVISSFMSLGVTGTFLGDYFGILMDQKVTGFPFNVMENPMYWGSTANYLGLALMNASPVGVILTAVVCLSYKVAIAYEGPFTEEIYRRRSQRCKHK